MEDFFDISWEAMTGFSAKHINDFSTPEQRSEYLYQGLVSALDLYIQKYELLCETNPKEHISAFLTEMVGKMYKINQQHEGCWSDCWPTTALELDRANCAYGSLILARAINKAGIPLEIIDYATPGPLSHAAIIVDNFYADQANGVVVPVKKASAMGNIRCYILDLAGQPSEVADKAPFRLVPVHNIAIGVRSLVSNLDPLIEDAHSGNPEATRLVERFKIGQQKVYSQYAFDQLMPSGWKRSELMSHGEWKTEYEESSKRISKGITK